MKKRSFIDVYLGKIVFVSPPGEIWNQVLGDLARLFRQLVPDVKKLGVAYSIRYKIMLRQFKNDKFPTTLKQ